VWTSAISGKEIITAVDNLTPPSWCNKPTKVTDPVKVVIVDKEEACEPVRVVIMRGEGMTEASVKKLSDALEIAGEGAYYELDEIQRIARIFRPIKETPLLDYGQTTTTTATSDPSES